MSVLRTREPSGLTGRSNGTVFKPAEFANRDKENCAMRKLRVVIGRAVEPARTFACLVILLASCSLAHAQSWSPVITTQFPVGVALQLTDGTILINQNKTSNWWILSPDLAGNYADGKFTQVASFPASLQYAPVYYASAVLKDGRVIVEGGEYNYGTSPITKWVTKGAIFDPPSASYPIGKWTPVNPPTGWTTIGDAQSVVLPTGQFMLANCCDNPAQAALLDEATLTWTILNSTTGFVGKFDRNDEEGWTLLPNGKVLTVDTYTGVPYNPTGMNSEIYDPIGGSWTSAGNTVKQLWDSRATCGGSSTSTHETGNAVLMTDGTVFATGADSCKPFVSGHTALFNSASSAWTAGPDIPGNNDVADGPAVLLPNGHVLVDTNPGYGSSPSTFYEFDGANFITTIPQPLGDTGNTEGARLLVTAAGSVLLTHVNSNNIWFYHHAGTYQPAWQPTITGCYPAVGYIGNTYSVCGTQFNGLSQASSFGDDAQSATNYPLVRITNSLTGHKFYARTHGHSTMAVATGSQPTSTSFDILPGTETGDSSLVVIANGIPSNPVGFKVLAQP